MNRAIQKEVVRVLPKTALNAGILATACFNVAVASEPKSQSEICDELLGRLRVDDPPTYGEALEIMRQKLGASRNIAALERRPDLHNISVAALKILDACLPGTDFLIETGLSPARIADAMLINAGDPERGGSSLFETYAGHRAVFHALCMEGLEAVMLCEGPLRRLLTGPFEKLLKQTLRPQNQLDRILSVVRQVSVETGAPAGMLEAAYRARVLQAGRAAEDEEIEVRMRRIAEDYEVWRQLILGIDGEASGSAALRKEALAFLEAGRFDKAQAKFKEVGIIADGEDRK